MMKPPMSAAAAMTSPSMSFSFGYLSYATCRGAVSGANLRHMGQGPRQTDFSERKQVVGIAFLLVIILSVWEGVGRVFSPLLLVGNLIVAVAIALAIQRLTLGAATELVGKIYATGNVTPTPSYSLQESMIVRGRYEDAAESFRNHIAEHPEDLDARLALARLLEGHLRDYGAAERMYLEVRRNAPTPNQEMAAANGLIDLCRKAGRDDRPGAQLELRKLEAADLTNESPRSPT